MPLAHPLANANIDQIHAHPWPDSNWVDVSSVRADALVHNQQYAVLGGDWSPFWHDAIDLLGMDNLMIKMYEDPELVDALFQHICNYYLVSSDRILTAADGAIDIFFIGNDFGSQSGPLLSDALFRRFILPHLSRFVDLGHSHGIPVMLHCCGGIYELLPAMIEIGLDAIHAVQPSCRGMDLARLKREFGHLIVFNGGIDSHHVLIQATQAAVREETRKVLEIMMPGGGYICGASHDSILEETPVDNVIAMFDAVREFGRYEGQ